MKALSANSIRLQPVATPTIGLATELPSLPDHLYPARLAKLRQAMAEQKLDFFVLYADREHFSNFRYLVGFEPRFEEGILVISANGPSSILLGNECYPMYASAKIPVEPVLSQALSLPNQTMDKFVSMQDSLKAAGLDKGNTVGLAGWKLFTDANGPKYKAMFCAPSFITDAVRDVVGSENVVNATGLLIDPDSGIRIVNEPEQIAVFEYGSALASQGVMNLWHNVQPGKSEMEMADCLVSHGLPLPVHPIVAAGPNIKRGLVSPTSYRIQKGDALNVSVGLEGGLSCRAGYVVETEGDLPAEVKTYINDAIKPYYAAVASWYGNVGVGVAGGEMYDLVEKIIPKEKHGWVLNPGHLIGTEEWLSSPIYSGSKVALKSGMLIQMDIIPSGPYVSPNVEDGVLLADATLRDTLKKQQPEVWQRMQARREFMKKSLGIEMSEDVLPMSNLAALYRPLALNRELALVVAQ